jgi:hypothetical protein
MADPELRLELVEQRRKDVNPILNSQCYSEARQSGGARLEHIGPRY